MLFNFSSTSISTKGFASLGAMSNPSDSLDSPRPRLRELDHPNNFDVIKEGYLRDGHHWGCFIEVHSPLVPQPLGMTTRLSITFSSITIAILLVYVYLK